ncbi:hypothetical protein RB195_004067 [Necator americanus]|uniref:Uncharacterized protein n=1 Tax=Necator americanus TaxID=51031 RepID=A0ABR1BKS5_NECAM
MTIPVSLNTNEKSQDFVESDVIQVISGTNIRRLVYTSYIIAVVTSTLILYLFPSTVLICGFVGLMVLLIGSLYPLVNFVIKAEDHDLIWDGDGLHWLQKTEVTSLEYGNYGNDIDQSFKVVPTTSNYYLSYAFI